MKVEKTDNGWNEIVTTNITLKYILLNFQKLDDWLFFIEKHPDMSRNKKKCQCCKKYFKDIGTDIALAMCKNAVNKALCQICATEFKEKGIETIIK